MKVIIDDKIPFIQGALEPYADVEYHRGDAITRKTIQDADALIVRTRTKCNARLLEKTSVKFIASATIGYDHIDTEYCERRGIVWQNAPGCNSGSVMQYVASALLCYAEKNGLHLKNHVLGVVGVGNVGKKVVKMAEILGMQVVLNDPPRARKEGQCGFISLEGVLREADIITIHVPLIHDGEDKTFHLADRNFFEKMNRKQLFINTSRGEVVDSTAVENILAKGELSGAILDVWENEPFIDKKLLERVFIGTPHIAGYSADGKANGTKMVVRELSRFFHLGLDEWEPENVPPAARHEIFSDGSNKDFQKIAYEVVVQTYSAESEGKWLKTVPGKFEQYRGNYPVRREFGSYTIKARHITETDIRKLKQLGFRVENQES